MNPPAHPGSTCPQHQARHTSLLPAHAALDRFIGQHAQQTVEAYVHVRFQELGLAEPEYTEIKSYVVEVSFLMFRTLHTHHYLHVTRMLMSLATFAIRPA